MLKQHSKCLVEVDSHETEGELISSNWIKQVLSRDSVVAPEWPVKDLDWQDSFTRSGCD